MLRDVDRQNSVLCMTSLVSDTKNEILGDDIADGLDVADQIARRSVADREAEYADEVRRLLAAGLAVMVRLGTKSSPRVADVVAEARLSNDVFYRHCRTKDDLVTAILEGGTSQLHRRLVSAMEQADDPAGKVRAWITGLLAQAARAERADAIRAVLWNGARVSDDTRRRISARETLAQPLVEPLAQLGSRDPARDALLVCLTSLGRLEHFLWRRETPSTADIDHLVAFCSAAIGAATIQQPKKGTR
jgi:AcrR family transcriptional regulator